MMENKIDMNMNDLDMIEEKLSLEDAAIDEDLENRSYDEVVETMDVDYEEEDNEDSEDVIVRIDDDEDSNVINVSECRQVNNFVNDFGEESVDELLREKQLQEVANLSRAIQKREVLIATVYGLEEMEGDVKVVAMCNSIRVVVPASDFFKYSAMPGLEKEDSNRRYSRIRQRANHLMRAKFHFMPLKLVEKVDKTTGSKLYTVIGSRSKAMEKLQEHYFFGPTPLIHEMDVASASIIMANPRYLTIECLGVESLLPIGDLSGFEFLENCTDKYNVGMILRVAVATLEIDAKEKFVDISFSRAFYEQSQCVGERVSKNMIGNRYLARISGHNEKFYFALFNNMRVRAIIPRKNYVGSEPLARGDEVSVIVYDVNEEKNRLVGGCIKI